MGELTSQERACVDAASAAPMLIEVESWAAINSGSRNLDGLKVMADRLADAFALLPGDLRLVGPTPVEAIDVAGKPYDVAHGRNLHLKVRPEAPVQLLFTGHMDTVFGADHPFQSLKWIEPDKLLGGPGVADMKGGIAVMLAALKAVEASPAASVLGRGSRFAGFGSADRRGRARQARRADL